MNTKDPPKNAVDLIGGYKWQHGKFRALLRPRATASDSAGSADGVSIGYAAHGRSRIAQRLCSNHKKGSRKNDAEPAYSPF